MYETYYGFAEKPFSLTPDPKYLYRSQSHANAFELLQYAIRRREGFVVVTGDIGTGKTTLCRALLEEIDRTTFTALVLNPFLSEEDLLKRILQDFGVVSREDIKAGRLAGVSKQELIDDALRFSARPHPAQGQRRADHRRGAEPAAVGARADPDSVEPRDRQGKAAADHSRRPAEPAGRCCGPPSSGSSISACRFGISSSRSIARPSAAYVAHRLTIAGGSAAVTFAPKALDLLHRLSGGIPRLINLICDRALLAAFSVRENRITPDMVAHAAESLDVQPSPRPRFERQGASLAGGGGGRAGGVGVRRRVDHVSLSAICRPDGSCFPPGLRPRE